jgi:hypothetical protein
MEPISARVFTGGTNSFQIDIIPHECPFCHKSITPRKYEAFWKDNLLEVVFCCPDGDCGRVFLAQYGRSNSGYKYLSSSIGTFQERKFSENIYKLSLNFTDIYNQALKAESLNLDHIAGIGYRKALEFLIKDYLIIKYPEKSENISKKLLGKCIKDDVENVNLKEMSERAAWLGNDETHYVRKWVDKDLKDLKILINVSLHWIDMELLTKQYRNEMSSE